MTSNQRVWTLQDITQDPQDAIAEIERLRGEAEVADEQLAQLRGFAEAHKTCRGSDETESPQTVLDTPEKPVQCRCGWKGDASMVSQSASNSSLFVCPNCGAKFTKEEWLLIEAPEDQEPCVSHVAMKDYERALRQILSMAVQMGADSGHSGIEAIARAALEGSSEEPSELPEALRDPVKNLERGRELLKEWGPTPVTDAALAESKESPLARAVRIARGDTGPPPEPVRFAEKASEPFEKHPDYCMAHGGHLVDSPACKLAREREKRTENGSVPQQPPVDNDHVAPGCEKFDE